VQAGCGQLRARDQRGDERGVEIVRKRLAHSAS
jgi:hypothetical protein